MSKARIYARNLAAQSAKTPRKLRILTTMVSGGMLWQARSVTDRLGDDHEYLLVTAPDDFSGIRFHFPDRKIHVVPFPSSTALVRWYQKLSAPVTSLWHCARLVFRLRPDVVFCVGTCLAIPLFFWGRLIGAKTVFVESITRVTRMSMTGRLVLFFRLSDRFYVQWPQLGRAYRRTLYRGNVL